MLSLKGIWTRVVGITTTVALAGQILAAAPAEAGDCVGGSCDTDDGDTTFDFSGISDADARSLASIIARLTQTQRQNQDQTAIGNAGNFNDGPTTVTTSYKTKTEINNPHLAPNISGGAMSNDGCVVTYAFSAGILDITSLGASIPWMLTNCPGIRVMQQYAVAGTVKQQAAGMIFFGKIDERFMDAVMTVRANDLHYKQNGCDEPNDPFAYLDGREPCRNATMTPATAIHGVVWNGQNTSDGFKPGDTTGRPFAIR